jgi:pimeloyl-ACP methyl ester carboxylesterase
MTVREITLHGDRVAYHDEGAGEPLLLIHGMGGTSNAWRAVMPTLAKKYRVIAPDLLGHGQSDKPRGDYSLGAFAVLLRDLLDALDIPQATIIGHSLGGGIAMQFAHQHRQYCRRIVLISSGGLGSELSRGLRLLSLPGSELMLSVIASRPALRASNALRARLASSGRDLSRFSEVERAHESLSSRENRQAFLRTLRAVVDRRGQAVSALNRLDFIADLPVMIISGDSDSVIPVAHAHAAHQAMPHSRLHVLPGVHHHPPVEQPETVSDLIDEFIDATAGVVHVLSPKHEKKSRMRSVVRRIS